MWDLIVSVPDHCLSIYSVFLPCLRYLTALACRDSGASIYTSLWTKWANTLKDSERTERMS